MKVLHICNNYLFSTVHKQIVEYTEKKGVHAEVFAPIISDIGKRIEARNQDKVVCCLKKTYRYIFYYKQYIIRKALLKCFELKDFEYIHAHSVFTDGCVALWIKKKYGIPYLVTVSNTDINHFFRYRIFLRKRGLKILREAKNIVFISESYKKTLFNNYTPTRLIKAFNEKSCMIPFAVDEFWLRNCYTNKKIITETIKLLFVGQICNNKGVDTIISAINELNKQGYKTVGTFIGEIIDKRIIDKNINNENKSNLIFKGKINKEELICFYRQNDIFILPSINETFGLVYAEALSQGLPIVYSKNQGFDCQFPEGYVGFHTNSGDTKELVQTIKRVIKQYQEIQERCCEASKKFNPDNMAKKYIELYSNANKRY